MGKIKKDEKKMIQSAISRIDEFISGKKGDHDMIWQKRGDVRVRHLFVSKGWTDPVALQQVRSKMKKPIQLPSGVIVQLTEFEFADSGKDAFAFMATEWIDTKWSFLLQINIIIREEILTRLGFICYQFSEDDVTFSLQTMTEKD